MDNIIKKGSSAEPVLLGACIGFNATTGAFQSESIDTTNYKVINGMVTYYFYSGGNYSRTLEYEVQGSNDNSTWGSVTSHSISVTANTNKQVAENVTIGTQYNYYRLQITMSGGGNCQQSGSLVLVCE